MKQSRVAELLGIGQSAVSRLERGEFEPTATLKVKIFNLVAANLEPSRDAGLRRLIDHSVLPVHLVCDVTHRLLAASRAREREWQRPFSELRGHSLWQFATEEIRAAEAQLPDQGWGEPDGVQSLVFYTDSSRSRGLQIAAGMLTWDRIVLADGSLARLVTSSDRDCRHA